MMRLTKLTHACVRLQKDGATLVIDPGAWSGAGTLDGADAILITHEHFDHLDADALRAAMNADPALALWTNPAVAAQFTEFPGRVHAVRHGDTFSAAGFEVHVHGTDHAVIHPGMPVVQNTGFLVDQTVFHPGDAFTIPDEDVPVLLLPVSAPWLKASEMIDYARAIAPRRGYAIHDELLNENGLSLVGNLLQFAAGSGGTSLARLEPGTSVDL